MNKKRLFIGILSLLIAMVSFVVIRNIFDTPPVVVEQNKPVTSTPSDTASETQVTKRSVSFKGVDDIHWGKGSAEILDSIEGSKIVFGDDFEVAQGPDLFVYLSPNEVGQELGEYASLGNLKLNSGTQEYLLPDNYKEYKSLVIWCRAFGVVFATADLR